MPRSGIVPPEITLSSRAPLRADEHVGLAIPGQARPQLGELVGRIAPGEHVEHADRARCATARDSSAARRITRSSSVDRPRLGRDHRDDLLREHVERAVGDADRLDLALEHLARDHRRPRAGRRGTSGTIRPMLVPPTWWPARPIRCSPRDTAPGDSTWITRSTVAHVDAELERAGRGDRAQPAGLERFLDLLALVPRDRAVVRAHQLDAFGRYAGRRRELGELLAEPLGEPPRVDEHDRRAVREDHLEQRAGRSAATCPPPIRGPAVAAGCPSRRRGHDDLEVDASAVALASTISTARSPPRYRATSVSGRWVADSPIRCGSGLPALVTRCAQPLERQREVDAALGRRERVDLVDDDRVDAGQAARARDPRARGTATPGVVIRIWPGSVRWRSRSLGGVSPVRTSTVIWAPAPSRCEAGERRAQVALDVVGERLDRRHVDDARAGCRPRGAAAARADRGTTGTPRASCRCRSARASACDGRARSAPSPAPGPASARRSSRRTTSASPRRTRSDCSPGSSRRRGPSRACRCGGRPCPRRRTGGCARRRGCGRWRRPRRRSPRSAWPPSAPASAGTWARCCR